MQVTIPALGKGRGQIELVEHAGDDVIDDVVDRLRMVIERRHRRHDRHAHAGELEHVLEMHLGERGLAHDQHQAPALLEHHVGGAVDEVLAVAVGDAGERVHRAGHHRHAVGLERTGGDLGAHVAGAMHDAGEGTYVLYSVAGLVLERALRPLADDEVGFDLAALERLKHPHAEDGAGRAGHADNEPPHSVSSAIAGSRTFVRSSIASAPVAPGLDGEQGHEIRSVARTSQWCRGRAASHGTTGLSPPDQSLNRCPNFAWTMRRSSGVGTFTLGNLSRQCQGRQASMIARLLV